MIGTDFSFLSFNFLPEIFYDRGLRAWHTKAIKLDKVLYEYCCFIKNFRMLEVSCLKRLKWMLHTRKLPISWIWSFKVCGNWCRNSIYQSKTILELQCHQNSWVRLSNDMTFLHRSSYYNSRERRLLLLFLMLWENSKLCKVLCTG